MLTATDKTCDGSCRPGFDHDALLSCEDKQTDEFLSFFVLAIEKCVRFVEAYDARTVLRSSIRVIGLSRMGMPVNSLPSNFGFLVKFPWLIVSVLMVMEE